MKTIGRAAVLATMAGVGLLPVVTMGQTARQGGGANPQALIQLQQLANENTALQAERSKLKGELEKASQERDSLRQAQESVAKRSRGVEGELAKAVSDRARLEGELAQEKSRVQELVSRLRETAVSLRDVETDRTTSRQTLSQREQELRVCVDRNQKLIALNDEVLKRFEDEGFWSAVARREPFTKLKRTQLENLADGYRNVALDNRVEPAKP